jgi:hypothetical protein
MDFEVQKALRTIQRAGTVGLAQLLATFPVLRHTPTVAYHFDEARYRIERNEEWRRWMDEIPAIEFPAGWKIKVIPPSVGAIVRFKANDISVYLDCYNKLGLWDGPYWEIYPAEDGDTERYGMADVEGLLDGLTRAMGPDGLDPAVNPPAENHRSPGTTPVGDQS